MSDARSDVILRTPIVASTTSVSQSAEFSRPLQTDRKSDTTKLLEMVSLKRRDEVSPLDDHAGEVGTVVARSPLRHAGVQPSGFRDITQDELVMIAMQNSSVIRSLGVRVLDSPGSVTTAYDVSIRNADPFFGPSAALAEFDSQLAASLNSQNNDRVFNNATLGGQTQELVQDTVDFNSSWQKRSVYGTQWDVRSIHLYDSNNRAGNRFPSYWETQLEIGVRQPLLRGAGKTFNLIAGPNARPGFNFSNGIWIARINTQITQADFEVGLRDYFVNLYTAYWELWRQYAAYDSIVDAGDTAYQVWQAVLSKKLSGLTGGEAYKEAQARAQYHRYQRELQLTLGGSGGGSGLYNAERTLRRLIGWSPEGEGLLRPVDPPASMAFHFEVDDTLTRALANRAELCRQRLQVQQHNLRLVAAKNFLLPQLDIVGRSRVRGFGDDLTGGGPRFNSAADDFFSLDHQEWAFGVEMGISPLRRRAKAAVRHAGLKLQRERQVLREQENAIAFEVQETLAEIESAFLAMQTSAERLSAAEDRLASSQALFDSGKIQLEFLIDAADAMLQSNNQLATDQSRYSLALIRIGQATGTLLSDLGVNCH